MKETIVQRIAGAVLIYLLIGGWITWVVVKYALFIAMILAAPFVLASGCGAIMQEIERAPYP